MKILTNYPVKVGYFGKISSCCLVFLKVAFIQKLLMRSSNLQTDEPNYFPELEILKLRYSKGQVISKCRFGAIVSTKKPTIFLKEFLP